MGSPKNEKGRGSSVARDSNDQVIEGVYVSNEAQVAVTLTKPFGLGKTEVTQGQWKSVMGSKEPWKRKPNTIQGENVPATHVDYDDAADFCERLTDLERKAGKLKADEEYRLPTEAEWEYACRAGTTTAFSFGDDESKLGEHAWFGGNTAGEQYAHKVGLKKPNPWGLYDMHGNVWERCSDWYGLKLPGGTDPAGADGDSARAWRGGAWRVNPGECRSAHRGLGVSPGTESDYIGFRVARSQSVQ